MTAVTSPIVPVAAASARARSFRGLRLAALAGLGLSLGAGGSILAVTWVQAEGMDMLANARNDHARREAARRAVYNPPAAVVVPRATYSGYVSSYAPLPPRSALSRTNERGQITLPYLDLNPFRPSSADRIGKADARRVAKTKTDPALLANGFAVDTVSGAANAARSICVRMCDGFHAPIGYLDSAADMPAHEALCKAMNPGVPVQVFRVPAGAATIDNAVASNGKTYGSLTVAYSHEKTADPACRPKVVGFKERRIAITKDFTLRAGDTVVTETGARVFNGGSRYPFASSDFRDFRSSELISQVDRRRIDMLVGATRSDQARREAQRALQVREASAAGTTAFDGVYGLRGSLDSVSTREPGRVVMPSPFANATR
jgi:hypothetical protein